MRKLKKLKTVTKKTAFSKFNGLRSGAQIAIVAPGSHAPFEILEKGAERLRDWGFIVETSDKVLNPQIFLSNTDAERFKHLKSSLEDPRVKAIWCLRGGYGAIRLLPFLAKMKKPKDFKLLIGLSDVSSLHIFLNDKWGWPTLHAPLVDRLAQGRIRNDDEVELKNLLHAKSSKTVFQKLSAINKVARNEKTIRGSVSGGNLMVVTSTLGTPYQISGKGKILFFEEISERAYRVDRCLQQLHQAGVFNGAKAVIFGEFTKCEEPDGQNYIVETLRRFFANLSLPAYLGMECGHGEVQRPIFFGTKAVLFCGESASIEISNEI